jgi:hypothetical protein
MVTFQLFMVQIIYIEQRLLSELNDAKFCNRCEKWRYYNCEFHPEIPLHIQTYLMIFSNPHLINMTTWLSLLSSWHKCYEYTKRPSWKFINMKWEKGLYFIRVKKTDKGGYSLGEHWSVTPFALSSSSFGSGLFNG